MDIIYCFFNAKTPMLGFTPMGLLDFGYRANLYLAPLRPVYMKTPFV